MASSCGNEGLVAKKLDEGADINGKKDMDGSPGRTVLKFAAGGLANCTPCSNRKIVDVRNMNVFTPMHSVAVQFGHRDVA